MAISVCYFNGADAARRMFRRWDYRYAYHDIRGATG